MCSPVAQKWQAQVELQSIPTATWPGANVPYFRIRRHGTVVFEVQMLIDEKGDPVFIADEAALEELGADLENIEGV